jgi:hypothetical protein
MNDFKVTKPGTATELARLRAERDAYLKALKEIADEQFGTVDECIAFADRCIRQMGGYR